MPTQQEAQREALKARFITNMRRNGRMTTHLHSGLPGLEKTDTWRSEALRADLLRAIVVLLHATVEDFIRSHFPNPNKKGFALHSGSDVRRMLHRLNVDPSLFGDLMVPLTRLAKRRNEIVHRADIDDANRERGWGLASDWELIHWNIAALAFYYRLRRATGPINMVEDKAGSNADAAFVKSNEAAQALLEIPRLAPELRKNGVERAAELLEAAGQALDVEVEMFLTVCGEPIDGVLEARWRKP